MTGKPMTFPEWLAVVDGELSQVFGRTHDQVDDWPWYDEYQGGATAEDAAHRMIEHTAIDYGLPGAGGAK